MRARESRKLEKLGLLAVVILVIVLIGFVIRSFVGNSDHASVSPERRGADDLTAAMACTEFNRAVKDLHAGVITDDQFAQRMQPVFNAGRLANTPLAREIFADLQRRPPPWVSRRLHEGGGSDDVPLQYAMKKPRKTRRSSAVINRCADDDCSASASRTSQAVIWRSCPPGSWSTSCPGCRSSSRSRSARFSARSLSDTRRRHDSR